MFQQVPLNVIESNTELISYYRRKKREATVFKSDIPGLTPNSVDSWESLSPAAQMALASISSVSADEVSSSLKQTAHSYFNELINQLGEKDETHSRVKRYSYEPTDRINSIFSQYEMLASDEGRKNCQYYSESDRRLPGDVIYGVQDQFESQAKLALSISHFLSAFYQIVNPEEDFPLRLAEKPLSEDQLYAEVISAIAADFRAVGVGIFFDRNKYKKERPYFGPYAFRERDNLNVEIQKKYHMVDLTGMPGGYIDEDWFTAIKSRWASSPEISELDQFYLKPFIRGDYLGKILVHYEAGYPQYFYGAKLK